VERATQILVQLEQKHIESPLDSNKGKLKNTLENLSTQQMQLKIFETTDSRLEKVKEKLLSLDINSMTPIEAMMLLNELKKIATK
jgi:DNA mismatch repair protein MutS